MLRVYYNSINRKLENVNVTKRFQTKIVQNEGHLILSAKNLLHLKLSDTLAMYILAIKVHANLDYSKRAEIVGL